MDDVLLEAVYEYIISSKYPYSCSENRKRTIRRKAKKFRVKDGILFYIQKCRSKVWCMMWSCVTTAVCQAFYILPYLFTVQNYPGSLTALHYE